MKNRLTLPKAGAIFGILLNSWVMDKYGRKGGVIFLSILSLVGGTIMAASQNIGMFIAGRFIAGGGSWGFLALSMYVIYPYRRTERRRE